MNSAVLISILTLIVSTKVFTNLLTKNPDLKKKRSIIFWTSLIITPLLFFTLTESLVRVVYKSFIADFLFETFGTDDILIGTYIMIAITLTSILPVLLWRLVLINQLNRRTKNNAA